MPIRTIDYLRWAKTHAPARYELTVSGVMPVSPEEFDLSGEAMSLAVQGAYGHPELLELIAERYGVATAHVLPVTGTSSANFVALASATERGQRIAVEYPAYEPLMRIGEMLDLELIRFSRDRSRRYAPTVDEIDRALQQGARVVVLSDLHNPSGCLCPRDELRQVAALCERHSATLLVDEVYRDFAHINCGVARETAATLGPHVIATNSLTKVYGFGGVRAGWLIGSAALIERARGVFDHLCVDLPAPSAHVAVRVLRDIERFEARTGAIHRHQYTVFSRWLATRQDLHDSGNDGAMFSYLKLPRGVAADPFCRWLRQAYDTQVVPGTFFGDDDHVRVGFGDSPDTLAEGLSRLGAAMDAYRA